MRKFLNNNYKKIIIIGSIIFIVFNISSIIFDSKKFFGEIAGALMISIVWSAMIILLIKLCYVIKMNKTYLFIYNYFVLILMTIALVGYSICCFIFFDQSNIGMVYVSFSGILSCIYIDKKIIVLDK